MKAIHRDLFQNFSSLCLAEAQCFRTVPCRSFRGIYLQDLIPRGTIQCDIHFTWLLDFITTQFSGLYLASGWNYQFPLQCSFNPHFKSDPDMYCSNNTNVKYNVLLNLFSLKEVRRKVVSMSKLLPPSLPSVLKWP